MQMKNNPRFLAILNDIKANPPKLNTTPKILLIDGLNTFFRAYCSSPVLGGDGRHMGGVTGFLLSIGAAIRMLKPSRVIIVFDGKGGSQRRREIHSEYKNNRRTVVNVNRAETLEFTPEEERQQQTYQLIRLVEYLRTLPVNIVNVDNIEADDAIAYIATNLIQDQHVYIMSRDKDFYQLISDQVTIWSPTKKQIIDLDTFIEEFDMLPANYMLARAIVGDDVSDNIKGVPGIGMKSLIGNKLIPILTDKEQVMTIEEIIQYVEEQISLQKSLKKPYKKYQAILDNVSIIERNLKLTDLKLLNISGTAKLSIIDQFDISRIPQLQRRAFFKLLVEDGIETAIRNVDVWIRELFFNLDKNK